MQLSDIKKLSEFPFQNNYHNCDGNRSYPKVYIYINYAPLEQSLRGVLLGRGVLWV